MTGVLFAGLVLALSVPAAAQTEINYAIPDMVKLSTGSELATWTLPPIRREGQHKTPVIFLHGGPGMYTTVSARQRGAPLGEAGFTTVYFDQAGGGKSKPLPAADYTIERAIADVEAFRVAKRFDKIILWGNSYGAGLATLYAVRFPDRVAGIILTSPGSFPGTKPKRNYGITNRDKVRIGKELSAAVSQIDSKGAAAEANLPQAKVNALFDTLVNDDLMGGMVCKGATVTAPPPGKGGNLYANRLIDKGLDGMKFKPDGPIKIPALVIRGSCDFLPDSNAQRLAALFATSVVTVPGTGHGLIEKSAEVDALLSRFAQEELATVE
jgi:pimeloyl-ACP methyl ester carboxylesterase